MRPILKLSYIFNTHHVHSSLFHTNTLPGMYTYFIFNQIIHLTITFCFNNINFEIFLEEVDIEFRWRNLIYNNYSKKINIDPKVIQKEVKKMIKNEKKTIKFNLSEIEIFIENNLINVVL